MRRIHGLVFAAAVVLGITLSAASAEEVQTQQVTLASGDIRASQITGAGVYIDENKVGTIADFVLDSGGKIKLAKLIIDDVILGWGGKSKAVSWGTLKYNPEKQHFETTMSESDLQAAPEFK